MKAQKPETTAQDCARVLAQYPDLTANGFSNRTRDGEICAGAPLDSEETRAQIDRARQFLRECCYQTKTIRPFTSSYGLKHEAERWMRGVTSHSYISNGAFIAAAVLEGYRLERPAGGGPNCSFALGETQQYRAHRHAYVVRRGSLERPANWVRE